jgi:hypothetical protein
MAVNGFAENVPMLNCELPSLAIVVEPRRLQQIIIGQQLALAE